ncbi:hypothetical protein D1872_189910 [compost metagenome]
MPTFTPPSDVTASTIKSASCSWTSWEILERGCSAPVDVSACTTATAFTPACSCNTSSTCSGRMISPHEASIRITSAPQRSATSTIRSPNRPFTPMTTLSPGSSRLTNTVSIPELPVPDIASVSSFFVSNTVRINSIVSFIICKKLGSRCPMSGVAIAFSTRG